MGWTSSSDMNSQVKMRFDSKKAAIAHAESAGYAYQAVEPHKRQAKVRQGGYGENFASNRKTVWTH